jgi:hypothetical protein
MTRHAGHRRATRSRRSEPRERTARRPDERRRLPGTGSLPGNLSCVSLPASDATANPSVYAPS